MAIFGLTIMIAGLPSFASVWMRYGASFLTYENHARPDWQTIAWRSSGEVWGNVGLFGLATVAIGILTRVITKRKPLTALPTARNPVLVPAPGMMILL